MKKYEITPEAVSDLFHIWSFINRDNPDAADRVEAAILRACEFLSPTPFAGRTRKELTSLDLRFWVVHPYSSYLVVYDPAKKPLRIIRILHAARDIPSVLK